MPADDSQHNTSTSQRNSARSLMVKHYPYTNSKSLPFKFRQKRFVKIKELIEGIIHNKGSCRIIDIGGVEIYWDISEGFTDDDRIQIDLLNINTMRSTKPNFRTLKGSAADLEGVSDMSYDMVHSNSVVEHVGSWSHMQKMAKNVRRLAPIYYVQTPYFWFPYEPHFRFPIFHWLPEQIRYRLLLNLDLGFGGKRKDVDSAMRAVQSSNMLDKRQVCCLFPDAKITFERVLFLPKSLIAIRAPGG